MSRRGRIESTPVIGALVANAGAPVTWKYASIRDAKIEGHELEETAAMCA